MLVLVVARLFIVETRVALIRSLGTRFLVTTDLFTVALAAFLESVLETMIVRLLLIIATVAKSPAVGSLLLLGLTAIRAVLLLITSLLLEAIKLLVSVLALVALIAASEILLAKVGLALPIVAPPLITVALTLAPIALAFTAMGLALFGAAVLFSAC
jgi:hypothetical protein